MIRANNSGWFGLAGKGGVVNALHVAILAAALAGATGIYAVAVTAATTLAASINTTETERHSRSVEFSNKAYRDSARHRPAVAERKAFTITWTTMKDSKP